MIESPENHQQLFSFPDYQADRRLAGVLYQTHELTPMRLNYHQLTGFVVLHKLQLHAVYARICDLLLANPDHEHR